jgi:ABC-type amino acid transport substrate-binding protein
MNKEVVFKEFEFDALILALDKGQIDVILSGLSITESRQKEIAMIPYQGESLTDLSVLFWQEMPEHLDGFVALKDLAINSKLAVSVQSGHFLEDFLRGEGIPVKTLAGPPEQILDIKYRKSFAAVVDSKVGLKLAAEHEGIKNRILPLPREKWDLGNGIGIKKTRIDLIDEIRRAVEQLKADGTLQNLNEKWIKVGL